MGLKICVFVLIALSGVIAVSGEKNVVCYYGSWATYRSSYGQFNVEHINPFLCTHVVYAFVGIDFQGYVVSLDPFLDLPDNWGKNNFGKFNALKQTNPKLKTILAVGGWNEGSGKYSVMAANPVLRKNFVTSALEMVQKYDFDGFDVDWEYPNQRDTVNGRADVENFTQLLKELREEFTKHGLILTVAVAATRASASLSYDIASISKYLDIIGIMTYDMAGSWDPVTGHNAPLHRGAGDENVPRDNLLTVDVSVEYWLDQGCPPEKLYVGLPFYGRTFTLANANVNTVRAPSSGSGIAGPYTVTSGTIGYNEFCLKLRTESWDVRYDSLAKVPYAVQNRNWVTYDDVDSIIKKVEYAREMKVAGVMVWSLETEDFHGLCSGEDYPLLRAINRVLERDDKDGESTVASSTTEATTSTTAASSPVTTEAPPTESTSTTGFPSSTTLSTTEAAVLPESGEEICTGEGFTADPEDCSGFYYCIRGVSGDFVPINFRCPNNLHWDNKNHYCNYPEYVNCSA